MLNALAQSPLMAKKIFEWKEKLEKEEILVREIIDIDSTYMDIDDGSSDSSKKSKIKSAKKDKDQEENKKNEKDGAGNATGEESESSDEDEFNISLAAMENEIKPKVISIITYLSKNYSKLISYQKDKLQSVLNGQIFSASREKGCKKIIGLIVEKIKILQLSASVLEELVQSHYVENRKIISLEGNLLRLALENKISRQEFLKYYLGNEINPNLKSFLNTNKVWKAFFKKIKRIF